MKKMRLFAIGLFALASAAAAAPPTPSHCGADEEVLFTCRIGSKVLSFCAPNTNDDRLAPAWIQYRFGRIGATELVFPATKTSPVGHFRYTTDKGGRWVVAIVQFSIDDFSYVLTAYGNSNIPESEASLLVVRPEGARRGTKGHEGYCSVPIRVYTRLLVCGDLSSCICRKCKRNSLGSSNAT